MSHVWSYESNRADNSRCTCKVTRCVSSQRLGACPRSRFPCSRCDPARNRPNLLYGYPRCGNGGFKGVKICLTLHIDRIGIELVMCSKCDSMLVLSTLFIIWFLFHIGPRTTRASSSNSRRELRLLDYVKVTSTRVQMWSTQPCTLAQCVFEYVSRFDSHR
jgi:hypothetical protein